MNKKIIKKIIISTIIASTLVSGLSASVNATSGYAYSMGGLTTPVSQIISTADNWALCGYTSYYNTDITYSYLANSNLINSSILYFSGPGGQNTVKLEDSLYFTSGYTNGTNKVGVCSYTLSNTKLVVFNAGYTASGTSNICTMTRNKGAKATIGWVSGLLSVDSTKWEQRFQSYVVSGHTISASMDYADSFTDYNDNMDTKDHVVYGSWNQILSLYYSSSSNETQQAESLRGEDDRVVPITEIECAYDDVDMSVFEDTIAAYDADFALSDYEISAVSTSEDDTSFVVDITKKVGEFSTSSGYTFIFHDEKADVMYDNTIDSECELRGLPESSARAERTAYEACETAASEKDDGYVIVDQSSTKFCDLETGELYNKVITECKETDGDCYYSYCTMVPVV